MKRRNIVAIGVGVLVATMVVLGLSTVLLAQAAPGDVGSAECLAVQEEAQDAVAGNTTPYKNHGQMVKVAANLVSPYVDAGEITEECSSCIMNQFARKIAIEDQETCGPLYMCEDPGTCSTYEFGECGAGGNCGSLGVCVQVYEGGGVCHQGVSCTGLTECADGTGACAVGEVCGVGTCCGGNVCLPPASFCYPPQE